MVNLLDIVLYSLATTVSVRYGYNHVLTAGKFKVARIFPEAGPPGQDAVIVISKPSVYFFDL